MNIIKDFAHLIVGTTAVTPCPRAINPRKGSGSITTTSVLTNKTTGIWC